MYSLRIKFEIAYAHRLMTSYSASCRGLHGHNGVCEILIGNDKLNEDMMVVDFKKIKEIVKETLEEKYDHSTILYKDDPLAEAVKPFCNPAKFHLFEKNPTAEYMAERFTNELQEILDKELPGTKVLSFSFEETSNNKAIFES